MTGLMRPRACRLGLAALVLQPCPKVLLLLLLNLLLKVLVS